MVFLPFLNIYIYIYTIFPWFYNLQDYEGSIGVSNLFRLVGPLNILITFYEHYDKIALTWSQNGCHCGHDHLKVARGQMNEAILHLLFISQEILYYPCLPISLHCLCRWGCLQTKDWRQMDPKPEKTIKTSQPLGFRTTKYHMKYPLKWAGWRKKTKFETPATDSNLNEISAMSSWKFGK